MTDAVGLSGARQVQTQQTEQSRSAVGTIGKHSVQLGDGPKINLNSIKTNKVPFAGFRAATKIASAKTGMAQNGAALAEIFTCRNGRLDAKALMQTLKTFQLHLDRHISLNPGLNKAQMDKEALAALAPQIENLSNAELASAYQGINSAETSLLKQALQREAALGNQDAKAALANLMNVEALLLVEVGNRVVVGRDPAAAASITPLSQMYGSEFNAPQTAPAEHRHDITAANLETLVMTDAHSGLRKAQAESEVAQTLAARQIEGIEPRQMGDILRSSELTMNADVGKLIEQLDHSDEPWKNAFHYSSEADQGFQSTLSSSGYMLRRDAAETALFPELAGREINPDERPVYAALNPAKHTGGAVSLYGKAALVFKPEVARRATYTVDDTFRALKLKVNPERTSALYQLVPGFVGEGRLSADTAAKLADPHSRLRTDLDQILQGLAAKGTVTAHAMDTALDGLKGQLTDKELQLLQALCIKSFADPEANQGIKATYDNIESLLTQFAPLDNMQLANSAVNRQQGQNDRAVLTVASYVEAQLQGPMILERDVAEIRVSVDDIEPEQMEKLNAWAQEHGIKVTYFGDEALTVNSEEVSEAMHSGREFAASHVDKQAVNAELNRIIDSDEAFTQKIKDRFAGQPSILAAFGGQQPLQGAALQYVKSKFASEVQRALTHPDSDNITEEVLINRCFDAAADKMVRAKSALMSKLDDLEFKTPEQKQAFTNWVLSARTLTDPNEMTMLYQQAMQQSELLQQLADEGADSQKVISELNRMFRSTDSACAQYYNSINKRPEPDEKFSQLYRTSFLSAAFLRASGGDMQAVSQMLDVPETKEYFEVCSALSDSNSGLIDNEDFSIMSSAKESFNFLRDTVAKEAGVQMSRLDNDPRSFEQLDPQMRSKIREQFPHAAAELDEKHPFSGAPEVFQPFPQPIHPERMPQDQTARRQFLIDTLPAYAAHEQSFDKDAAVHGRNHVVRSFIYATAMSNLLQEKGIAVDMNAVLCGIAGHDQGRQANGPDRWEADSARMTVEKMQSSYGADTLGIAYEEEFKKQIDGHSGKTVEAMLLQSADSLDIGRTQEFNLDKFGFLKETFKVGDRYFAPDAQVRTELAKEARLLQILTSPAAARRDEMNQLLASSISSSDPEAVMAKVERIKQEIAQDTQAQFAVGDAALVSYIEGVVRNNPQMFPLLNKYYR